MRARGAPGVNKRSAFSAVGKLSRFRLYGLASALFTICTCLLASLPVVPEGGRREVDGEGRGGGERPSRGVTLYYSVLRSTLSELRARLRRRRKRAPHPNGRSFFPSSLLLLFAVPPTRAASAPPFPRAGTLLPRRPLNPAIN